MVCATPALWMKLRPALFRQRQHEFHVTSLGMNRAVKNKRPDPPGRTSGQARKITTAKRDLPQSVKNAKAATGPGAQRYRFVTQEKSGGATYTPVLLADFVAEQIADAARFAPGSRISILDPAIGDGALLISLLNKLRMRDIGKITVHGFETDAAALKRARQNLRAAFPDLELRFKLGNFLEYAVAQAQKPARRQQFFDLVIANPPYVRTQIMGSKQAQRLGSTFGLTGRVDLYHAFLIGIAKVLRPDGTAGIIVSNRFMTTRGGASIRAAMRERLSLHHIWDLGDTKLFDAAVLPAVILAHGSGREEASNPAFTSIYETADAALSLASDPIAALRESGAVTLDDGRRFRVQHGRLQDPDHASSIWRLATDSGDAWLAAVAARTWGTFRDIGKIRVGVKTCADSVFIRDDWSDFPGERPELLRPLTTHHGATRFRSLPASKPRAILYPHENAGGKRRAIDLRLYPNSRAYLQRHRKALETRKYVIEAGRRWYEIWVPQDPDLWRAPKLIFRDISESPTFWLDLAGTVVNGDCYWLTPARAEDHELLWLAAAVANSTFAEAFYDHRFNNKLYAGRRRFITQYVEQFPLPDPAAPLSRRIIAGAKAVYAANGAAKATAMQREIEAMVWQAFGLGVEEIRR